MHTVNRTCCSIGFHDADPLTLLLRNITDMPPFRYTMLITSTPQDSSGAMVTRRKWHLSCVIIRA